MSILITTYEGTHNHPLPVSATAMASTTSAAAAMLLSGSSTSSSSGAQPPSTDQIHRFSTFDSSKWNINKQFYLPNSSHSAYSSFSSSHPTITLDLTSTPSSSSSSHLLNKFSSSSSSSLPPNYPHLSSLHYPCTSLSFGSSDSNNLSWSNNNNIINGFLSYGNISAQSYNLKNQIGTLGLGRQTTSLEASNIINSNVNYQNYMQKPNPNPNPNPSITSTNQVQSLVPDTIAAATKAITADPTFQSALAAALSSIIGGGGGQGGNLINQGGGDHNGNNNVAQKLKWGGDIHHHDHQQFPVSSSTGTTAASFLQTAKGNGGCATTFLNKTAASTNSQPAGNLMFLSPNSLPFSASKSASASPGDSTREQTS